MIHIKSPADIRNKTMKYQERNIKLLKYLQLSIQPSWNLLCNYEEWLAADYKLNSELFICFVQKVSYGGENFTEAADVLSMHQPNTSSRTCDRTSLFWLFLRTREESKINGNFYHFFHSLLTRKRMTKIEKFEKKKVLV